MKVVKGCSFCGRKKREVKQLIGGPNGIGICGKCLDLCNRIVAGQPTADFEGLEGRTEADLLAALAYSDKAVEMAREALQKQVDELRRRGVSWSQIGEALHVSRQSAWERFS